MKEGKMNKALLKKIIRNSGILKELIPPLFAKKIRKKISSSAIYDSYEAALLDADGYEDETLTKVVVAKAKIFAKEIILKKQIDLTFIKTFLGVASSLKSNRLKVIDFGGSAGIHYFVVRSILHKDVKIDWRVVETTGLVREAKQQGLESEELKFYDTIEDASSTEKFDLIFVSDSLQYVPNPYEYLKKLVNINADQLVLSRSPLADAEVVLLQHTTLSGHGVGEIPIGMDMTDRTISIPVTMIDIQKAKEILSSFGQIKMEIIEDKGVYVTKNASYDYRGIVVTR